MVQVEYLGETKTFSPQEISAMVLGKVRWSSDFVDHIQAYTVADEGDC